MHSPSTLNRPREYVGLFLFLALVSGAVWFTQSHASTRYLDTELRVLPPTHEPKNKPTPRCPHCAPSGDQEIYIPLIDIPEAAGGQIVFNSRSPHAMNVTPVFYKRGGEKVIGDPVTVQSAEIRYVDIRELLPQQRRAENDWGGFSLVYNGFNREMWSQFRLIGVNGGTNVDEFFTVKSESRADEFEAAWWMPEKSDAIIGLGNITDVATSAIVSFGDDKNRRIEIAPHATEILRYKSEKGESASSAAINVTGAPGSIVPTGLITSKDGSFNSVIRFYDPKLAKQANLYGNGFRVAGNTPHMVLRNTTANSVAVVPKFTPLAGAAAAPVVLSQVFLGAFETKEVDLSGLVSGAKRRHDLDVVSVEVTNLAAPGSIIGSLYGVNNITGMNYDIPLRDSGLVRTMTGSYPWKISDDFTTVVYITNISDQEAQFVGEVNCQGGKVAVDPRTLKPGETAVFDLQKFRDSQTADGKGNKLPRDVSIGQFKWSIFGVTNGKLLLIGRAEMVSRSQHVSSSYSCNDPCPPYISVFTDPLEPYLIVSQSINTSAWYYAQYDNGFQMGPYTGGANWSIDLTNAASLAPDSGHTTTLTGEDADVGGDVTLTADMGCQERYSWDGQNCYDNNFCDPMGTYQVTKIAGFSLATMSEGTEYLDGTSDFYPVSPCNVTCPATEIVRLHRDCPSSQLEYKWRKQFWVKYGIVGPRACVNIFGYAVSYHSFCVVQPECQDKIISP
jgi:hypothetical protein